ncbi:MAG: dephospho-CoA kinase [Rhodothermales bacterium]|nr:dephospho-CoA kinase [Rhodothermales bacterium]
MSDEVHELAVDGVDRQARPFVIRVTGGIGSGKSTLCRGIEALGVLVFNADAAAKRLMTEDPNLREAIQSAFGTAAYRTDGSLDRAHVANIVFGDDDALKQLNSLVHPAVFAAFDAAIEKSRARSDRFLVYEAALLVDRPDAENPFDLTVVVDSTLLDRMERARKRDGVDLDTIESRIEKQPPRTAYLDVADYVVVNDGSISDLERKAAALFDSIERDFLAGKSSELD